MLDHNDFRYRDFDDCWREEYILKVKEIDDRTRIRIVEVIIYDNDTDEPFYHSIKIQKVFKKQNGKWRFGNMVSIPFKSFLTFCQMFDDLIVERETNDFFLDPFE